MIRVALIKIVVRQLRRMGQKQVSGTFWTAALAPMVFLSNATGDVVSSFIQPSPPGYNTGKFFNINKLSYKDSTLLFKFCQQSKKKDYYIT